MPKAIWINFHNLAKGLDGKLASRARGLAAKAASLALPDQMKRSKNKANPCKYQEKEREGAPWAPLGPNSLSFS